MVGAVVVLVCIETGSRRVEPAWAVKFSTIENMVLGSTLNCFSLLAKSYSVLSFPPAS